MLMMMMSIAGFVAKHAQPVQGSDVGPVIIGLIAVVLVAAAWGASGARMAKKRFRSPAMGFALGAALGWTIWLGWIGLVVIAIMGTKQGPPCIECGMPLQMMWVGREALPARVCLVCGAKQGVVLRGPSGPRSVTDVPAPPVPVG